MSDDEDAKAKKRAAMVAAMKEKFGPDWPGKFLSQLHPLSDAGFSVPSFAPPPTPKKPHIPSPAEVTALRMIVTAIVAMLADNEKRKTGRPAQQWVNDLCATCSELMLSAEITSTDGRFDVERFRAETIDKIVEILAAASARDIFRRLRTSKDRGRSRRFIIDSVVQLAQVKHFNWPN